MTLEVAEIDNERRDPQGGTIVLPVNKQSVNIEHGATGELFAGRVEFRSGILVQGSRTERGFLSSKLRSKN